MRRFVVLLCAGWLITIGAGCSRVDTVRAPESVPAEARQEPMPVIDLCVLLTNKEIELILGAPLKDTKSSTNSLGGITVSQCYYLLPIASHSVVLTCTQRATGANSGDPKQMWEKMFDGEKADAREEEEEGTLSPSEKIEGIGDEAFWAPQRFGGALYVLKADKYLTITVGGPDDPATKMQKAKALAELALKRL